MNHCEESDISWSESLSPCYGCLTGIGDGQSSYSFNSVILIMNTFISIQMGNLVDLVISLENRL